MNRGSSTKKLRSPLIRAIEFLSIFTSPAKAILRGLPDLFSRIRQGNFAHSAPGKLLRRGLFVFVVVASSACQEQIVHDLSEREANRVVSRLHQAEVSARKVAQADGRWAISVSSDAVMVALRYLDEQRAFSPRDDTAGGSSSRSSILPSRKDQWFRYERSLALAIEESLLSIPGVLEAHVHLNLPEEDPLFGGDRREQGTASVLLLVEAECSARDEEVSALVGGAAGIPHSEVRVLRSIAVSRRKEETSSPTIEQAPPPQGAQGDPRSYWDIPWEEVGIVLAGVVGIFGTRRFFPRTRKPTVFSLPKELDFES